MTKSRLYVLTLLLCFVGYIWLFYVQTSAHSVGWMGCLFKKVYGIPCPACGSTRAVLALMNGDLKKSFLLNPDGLLLFFVLLLFPVWVVISILRKDDSFYWFYLKCEEFLQKKYTIIAFVILLIMNWLWNIKKGI